jgi:tetratricopeptide (TPR) repeat protein
LKIYEKTIKKESQDYADTIKNVGNIFNMQGNYKKALKCYKMSADIYKQLSGINSQDYC